jgi:hypothetical protein
MTNSPRLILGFAYLSATVGFAGLVAGAFAPVNDGNSITLLLLSTAGSMMSGILFLFYMHVISKKHEKTLR